MNNFCKMLGLVAIFAISTKTSFIKAGGASPKNMLSVRHVGSLFAAIGMHKATEKLPERLKNKYTRSLIPIVSAVTAYKLIPTQKSWGDVFLGASSTATSIYQCAKSLGRTLFIPAVDAGSSVYAKSPLGLVLGVSGYLYPELAEMPGLSKIKKTALVKRVKESRMGRFLLEDGKLSSRTKIAGAGYATGAAINAATYYVLGSRS